MPHMHNKETGDFQPLPKELVQVEAGLKVSFSPIEEIPEEIQGQTIRYVPDYELQYNSKQWKLGLLRSS